MSNPKKGNVLINGRTVVHKESGGVLITTDVCLTKIGKSTVPITYTNVARSVDADKTSSTVFVNGNPICHKNSIFSRSTGDEPGTRLGIRSGTVTGKAEFITGSPNVFIEGIPAVRHGDMMVSNNCNTAPMPLSQPGAPIAGTFKLSQVKPPEETELPDKADLGQSGEQAPLLRGLYRGDNGSNTAKAQRIFQYIDGEGAERYRELLISNLEAGTQHLSLLLNDKEFDSTDEEDKEYIVIPLGQTKTVKKDSPQPQSPKEFANFTVPLILKRYVTAEFDKAQTAELRQGWLYIYRNGYLWRELQVRENSFMADVNLRRHQGEHTRRASGESDSRVIVPWKIDNQVQTIEIAFSEVQWSWARINAMGGMEPDQSKELRLKNTTLMPTLSASETAKNRQERMQDITSELGQWLRGEGQDTENIQSAENVTSEIFSMLLHKNSKLPVLFIRDPLGLARDLAQKANLVTVELEKLQQADGHKAAMADVAKDIVAAYDEYEKYIGGRRGWKKAHAFTYHYDRKLQELHTQIETNLEELLTHVEQGIPAAIWQDYDTPRNHQIAFEELTLTILTPLSKPSQKQGNGGADAEDPNRLTKLLGVGDRRTDLGDMIIDKAVLISDRLTGYTDDLITMLGSWLSHQNNNDIFLSIATRYSTLGLRVSLSEVELAENLGDYTAKLPGTIRAGAIISARTGKALKNAVRGKKIILRQFCVNGQPVNTLHGQFIKKNAIRVEDPPKVNSRVAKTLPAAHITLAGLQVLNLYLSAKDFLAQQHAGADASTLVAYLANLVSDVMGLGVIMEPVWAGLFERKVSSTVAMAEARMLTGFLNAVAGVLLAAYEFKMAVDEWQSGDRDAAVGRAGMGVGALLMSGGGIGKLIHASRKVMVLVRMGEAVQSTKVLSVAAPMANLFRFSGLLRLLGGWPSLGFMVVSVIYYMLKDDNPMVAWLRHCAWGIDAYEGNSTFINRNGEKETIDYAGWKNNPDAESKALVPLTLGFAVEGKWTDNRDKLNNYDYQPHWERLKLQPQGFELKITVPPLKEGVVLVALRFYDEIGLDLQVFAPGKRVLESYKQDAVDAPSASSGVQPAIHTWGIGVGDIPDSAVKARATVWLDPYGDGEILLPHGLGLTLTTNKGSIVHASSI
jgi:uncharacterized Zn-binding protein involved in type VI secretion